MEHRAFVFHFGTFEVELKPILIDGLATGNCSELRCFIQDNLEFLSDPYEGEPLNSSWESMIEFPDAHQYGDFALTRYYRPDQDIGLGYYWEVLQEKVAGIVKSGESPILGFTVGPTEVPFDPGKMGTYFQTSSLARDNLRKLEALSAGQDPVWESAIKMLAAAVNVQRGLMITF